MTNQSLINKDYSTLNTYVMFPYQGKGLERRIQDDRFVQNLASIQSWWVFTHTSQSTIWWRSISSFHGHSIPETRRTSHMIIFFPANCFSFRGLRSRLVIRSQGQQSERKIIRWSSDAKYCKFRQSRWSRGKTGTSESLHRWRATETDRRRLNTLFETPFGGPVRHWGGLVTDLPRRPDDSVFIG